MQKIARRVAKAIIIAVLILNPVSMAMIGYFGGMAFIYTGYAIQQTYRAVNGLISVIKP